MPESQHVDIAPRIGAIRRTGRPDGPRGFELVREVRGLVRNTLPTLDRLTARWGDAIGVELPITKMVVLAHPQLVEELLVGNATKTGKGRSVRRTGPLIGRNLFVLEGDEHLRRRRIASPVFRPRDLAEHADWTAEHADAAFAPWTAGEPVDVGAALDRMTVAALGHTLFGRSLHEQTDHVLELSHAASASMPFLISPLSPALRHLPVRSARRVRAVSTALDAFVEQHVLGAGAPDGKHLVAMLKRAGSTDDPGTQLDRAELVQELRGFVLAGHDTTATMLTWCCQLLAQHPEVQRRIQSELDDVLGSDEVDAANVGELRYTRAVLDETLRLFGGTFVLRDALEPIELGPLRLPAGTEFLCSMWTIHRDERWWPEPLTFRPERFLEDAPERPRFAHLPFGGGRHVCIGRHLAIQSGVVVLAQLLRTWNLTPGPTPPAQPVSNILVRPDRPVVLTPVRRAA